MRPVFGQEVLENKDLEPGFDWLIQNLFTPMTEKSGLPNSLINLLTFY